MIDVFTHPLRVRFNECDPQGIVFFANYAIYVDVAYTELWREFSDSFAAFVEQTGVDVVAAELTLRYRASARFDDEIVVELRPRRSSRSSITTTWTIVKDGALLVDGTIRHVCVDASTFAKVPAPPELESAFPASS